MMQAHHKVIASLDFISKEDDTKSIFGLDEEEFEYIADRIEMLSERPIHQAMLLGAALARMMATEKAKEASDLV